MHNNHPLSPLRVFIDPVKITSKGQAYSVSFYGETIITNTLNPSGDACRYLVSRGFQGPLEVWDNERPYARYRFPDIEKAARLTVSENERHGPRIVAFKPMSGDQRQRLSELRETAAQ